MLDRTDTEILRLDGAAAWSQLTPVQQATIGPLMLEYFAASIAVDNFEDERIDRVVGSNMMNMLHAVESAMKTAMPFLYDAPHIPSSIGDICRRCGCSELDGCELPLGGHCAWHSPGLCTACALGRAA